MGYTAEELKQKWKEEIEVGKELTDLLLASSKKIQRLEKELEHSKLQNVIFERSLLEGSEDLWNTLDENEKLDKEKRDWRGCFKSCQKGYRKLQKDIIGFAEWIHENKYWMGTKGQWSKKSGADMANTTAELYSKYLQIKK